MVRTAIPNSPYDQSMNSMTAFSSLAKDPHRAAQGYRLWSPQSSPSRFHGVRIGRVGKAFGPTPLDPTNVTHPRFVEVPKGTRFMTYSVFPLIVCFLDQRFHHLLNCWFFSQKKGKPSNLEFGSHVSKSSTNASTSCAPPIYSGFNPSTRTL